MYVSPFEFKSLVKTKQSVKPIRKEAVSTPIQISGRQLKFTISTEAIDRDHDKVSQDGWQLDNYKKNPVVLWGHDASQLPVGKCVALSIENGDLCAVVEFVPGEINTMAESVYQLCLRGFLSATSVGFMPLEWEFSEEEERGADSYNGGVDFKTCELMEFSIVNVPANPEALIQDPIESSDTQPVAADEPEEDDSDSSKSLNNTHSRKIRTLMRLRLLEL